MRAVITALPARDDVRFMEAFPLSSVVAVAPSKMPIDEEMVIFLSFTGMPLSLRTNTLIVLFVTPSAFTKRGYANKSEVVALGVKSSFARVIEESCPLKSIVEANTVNKRKNTAKSPPSFLSITLIIS